MVPWSVEPPRRERKYIPREWKIAWFLTSATSRWQPERWATLLDVVDPHAGNLANTVAPIANGSLRPYYKTVTTGGVRHFSVLILRRAGCRIGSHYTRRLSQN
jgi:hypothetical protein